MYDPCFSGGNFGGFVGISGSSADVTAPAVALNKASGTVRTSATQARPLTPQPAPVAPPAANEIPISLKGAAKPAAKQYTYKAYGEK
jgi:hypothetical protein